MREKTRGLCSLSGRARWYRRRNGSGCPAAGKVPGVNRAELGGLPVETMKSKQAQAVNRSRVQARRVRQSIRQGARVGAEVAAEVAAMSADCSACIWSGRVRTAQRMDKRREARSKAGEREASESRLTARLLRTAGPVAWRREGLGASSVRSISGKSRRAASGARPLVPLSGSAVSLVLSPIQERIARSVGLPVRETVGGYVETKRAAMAAGSARRRRERELVEVFGLAPVVCGFLSGLARSAGRMAGRGARVSDTSMDEAGEAGRAAAVAWAMRAGGVGDDGLPVHLVKAALRPESIRAGRLLGIAKRAAVASLRAGFVCGMSGRSVELAKLRAAMPEVCRGGLVLDDAGRVLGSSHSWGREQVNAGPGVVNGSAADLAELINVAGRAWGGHRGSLSDGDRDRDGARAWGRALTLARAVRRLQAQELARLAVEHGQRWAVPGGASARAWGRTSKATRERFGKVGRVLVRVALGESLELACGLEGFGWDGKRGESSGFSRSMRELGLAKGLGLSKG